MTPARQADTASPHIVTLQAQELTHGRMTEQPDVMATRPARAALPMVMMSHTRVPVSILRSMALTSSPAACIEPVRGGGACTAGQQCQCIGSSK